MGTPIIEFALEAMLYASKARAEELFRYLSPRQGRLADALKDVVTTVESPERVVGFDSAGIGD